MQQTIRQDISHLQILGLHLWPLWLLDSLKVQDTITRFTDVFRSPIEE